MPGRIATQVDLNTAIPRIFEQVQTSTANHQKNFVALHKLHLEAAQKTAPAPHGVKLVGEREFESVFMDMLARVLPVKKGVTTADRVVKFVGGYISFINERAAEDKDDSDDDPERDTTASRFTAKLLNLLLKGFQAKDKNVRYRVIALSSEVLIDLGEFDEEIHRRLREALLDRMHDKEAIVRVQVVIALSKLSGPYDSPEPGEDGPSISQVLLDTLSLDSSADVRRALLVNMPVTEETLPALLERSRDTETTIRKLLFSFVLDGVASTDEPGSPRKLTIAQRELVVRNGLGDREQTVRAAAANLLGTWVDVVGAEGDAKAEEEIASRLADVNISKPEEKPHGTTAPEEKDKPQKIVNTLTTFLGMFDLTAVPPDTGGEIGKMPANALKSVFETRLDIFEDLYFGDAFFANLTPEKAFLARVFVDHCVSLDDKGHGEQRIDTAGIPVVTSCAFRIQDGYNALVEMESTRHSGDEDEDEREDARSGKESTVREMLKLAVNLDYADEIGRRKMFALVRDMLTQPALPLNLIPSCLDVLRKLSPNERDLIRVVVEIVQDLRDPGDEEEDVGAADQTQDTIVFDNDADTSFGSENTAASKKPVKTREDMSPEEQRHADETDLRCLSLVTGMLERVDGTLDENSTLQGIMADLIVPSVKRKDLQIREKGLIALGLFCLIAKNLALKFLPVFVAQAEEDVPEVLKLSLLHIIFDLLMVHGRTIFAPGGENAEKIVTFLVTQLGKEADKEDTSARILALLSTGIAKLVINQMITDEKAVKSLLMVYFSPYNADNQELKQCLAFSLPKYSHSSARNQRVMREIFTSIFRKLSKLRQALNDENDAIDLSQVTLMWIYWTDPFQVQGPNGRPGDAGDPLIQFEMAGDIIRAMLKEDFPKDDRKIICQMLGKLHIPDEVDVDKIRTLKLLMHTLNLRRPLRDATSNNAFKKFDAAISKKFEKELQDFDEDEYRKLEELKELFEFLDDIMPEDDEAINPDAKKKGKKRRSDSIMSVTTEGDDMSVASSKRGKSKPKAKRRRLSTSDDDESDFDDDDGTAKGTPPPATRTLPKRSAAVKKPEIIMISSDDEEDEDEDDDNEATPAARRGRPRVTRTGRAKEEAMIEADIDDLLDGKPSMDISHDSIMDDSDEEDEVNGLLVSD
ncbi:nuclear condensing complex subunit [Mycena galericulata]|nr:nuclear condensing complex subunit [Mycena galericulata]